MRFAWLLTLLGAQLGGCASSHHGDASDGGESADAGVLLDAPAVDAASDVPLVECERLGDFQRCDGACGEDRCPRGTSCWESLGLCLPISGVEGRCELEDFRSDWCWSGLPCAASIEGGRLGGPCVPVEACRPDDAGVAAATCIWSDRTAVVEGPPSGSCPAGAAALAPFCGGACSASCPERLGGGHGIGLAEGGSRQCIGVSDTRSFGSCVWSSTYCREPFDADSRAFLASELETCGREGYDGGECGCLVLEPEAGRGYFVELATCRAYADAHPSATCRDAGWSAL